MLRTVRRTGTMTPKQTAAKIRKLPVMAPMTTSFDRVLTGRGCTSHSWPMGCHKQHWINWLKGYRGAGHYGRKNWHRSAEFVYNHINCPPMVLWLAETSGVPRGKVANAKQSALSAKPSLPAQSAAIRRIIPWEMILACLPIGSQERVEKLTSLQPNSTTDCPKNRKFSAKSVAGAWVWCMRRKT